MPKDDMAIPNHIPDKAIKHALNALRADQQFEQVQWDVPRRKGNRPTKIFFDAPDVQDLHLVKRRLEVLLNEAGYDLY